MTSYNPIPGVDDSKKEADDHTEVSVTDSLISARLKINGNISGQENLTIDGTLEGGIELRECQVTVGETGKVFADITARVIVVEGEVKGDLRGSEKIVLTSTGRVTGDLKSPRVALTDGCKFKGQVDMENKPYAKGDPKTSSAAIPPKPQTTPYNTNSTTNNTSSNR